MKKIFISKLVPLLFSIGLLFHSCSGSDSPETDLPGDTLTPSNLTVVTTIQGATTALPAGDGSGVVVFQISATNANSYKVLVDGQTKDVSIAGNLTYTFVKPGSNIYNVVVTAYNGSKNISKTVTITVNVAVVEGVNAFQIVKNMGPGFNIGNVFDNGINAATLSTLKSIIDTYSNAGMKHVRIPVSWIQSVGGSTLASTVDGKLNTQHARLSTLKSTIDYALEKNLYVVLNTHHEHWLKDNYDGSASFNTKFTNLWTDIANYFKDYPNRLIFEVLNEPEGAMGQWGGAVLPTNANAISLTRQINLVGYNAIRNTGGANTTRIVMVSPNGQGNQNQLDDVYPTKANLPGGGNDIYLAVQVHTYDPWNFCGQDGADSNYPGSNSISTTINTVAAHAVKLNVPLNYGEFGVGRTSNSAQRNTPNVLEYYRTVATTTLGHNMSYSVWDDRGWFGLINSSGTGFVNNIVTTMLAN